MQTPMQTTMQTTMLVLLRTMLVLLCAMSDTLIFVLLLTSASLSMAVHSTFLCYQPANLVCCKESKKPTTKRQQKKLRKKLHKANVVFFVEAKEEPEPEVVEAKEEPEPEVVKAMEEKSIKQVFYCSLDAYEFFDPAGIGNMLNLMGHTLVKFCLPLIYSTNALRDTARNAWFDVDHPRAPIVAVDVIAPLVRQIVAQQELPHGKARSIAIIGDSTTAYCLDRAGTESITSSQLVELVHAELGLDDIFIKFYSVSGKSFFRRNGFLDQIQRVVYDVRNESYTTLLLVGGWNASEEDTTPESVLEISHGFQAWLDNSP